MDILQKKVGILGGGQLGRMLCQAASDWGLGLHVLDKSASYPAMDLASSFIVGSFDDYDDVIAFGKEMDILGIEIEHVSTDAMRHCMTKGTKVYPDPDTLDLIKDKLKQTQFYKSNGYPTPDFRVFDDAKGIVRALDSSALSYPFVQKTRSLGYDGSGVAIIRSKQDHTKLLDQACFVEDLVDVKAEIAVVVARNPSGEVCSYEPVEMLFDADANLLDLLICPARIEQNIRKICIELSCSLAEQLNIVGLLAVELFLDCNDKIWVNEIAPRPHNSGHHTIENSITSQYHQQLRALLDLPLGSTQMLSPAVMINLLGSEEGAGEAKWVGIESAMRMKNVYIHNYTKKHTRPKRKMGHATILNRDLEEAIRQAKQLKKRIKIIPK